MPTNEPISQLATFPASPTTATGTSADQIEILDINDTSMASTGTNKRVNMADLFSTFVTPGTGITCTKQTAGGGIAVASVTTSATVLNALLAASYTCTTTLANIGLSIALPSAGTYLLMANVRASIICTAGTLGLGGWILGRFYDSTNSVVVTNSLGLLVYNGVPVINQSNNVQHTAPLGPAIYSPTGPCTVQVQASYNNNGSSSISTNIPSDANGGTTFTVVRLY